MDAAAGRRALPTLPLEPAARAARAGGGCRRLGDAVLPSKIGNGGSVSGAGGISSCAAPPADADAALVRSSRVTTGTGRAAGGRRAGEPSSAPLLWGCVALALLLHALLGFGRRGLFGGGDLVPHLRLIQAVAASPGLYNPYAPAYHWLGAALAPLLGLELYPKVFGLGAALLLIAGFRSFQRAAGLPDACTALFALTPFLLAYSWCTPRVEAAGYALLLFGLGFLVRGRRVALALAFAACFTVHTAAALLFGLAASGLALARRDPRALLALAAGGVGALPLLAAHLAAGCTLPEALLFARGGYARSLGEELVPANWPWLVPLANPLALGAAALGARATWRSHRPVAWLALLLAALYGSNLWLAPLGIRTLVTLLRGLSVLAIPVAIAAGVWAAARPRRGVALLGLSAVYAAVSARAVVPQACFVRPIALEELDGVQIERCEFRWRAAPRTAPGAAAPGAGAAALRLAGEASEGLVLVRRTERGGDLWRARLSDGALRPLLETPERDELWPFFSPAAGQLLFQAGRAADGPTLLLLLDPGSGRVAPLAAQPSWREHWADWSPDGTRVAYVFAAGPGAGAARGVAEVELATRRRRVPGPDSGPFVFFRPEYAPDGRRLLTQRRGPSLDSFSQLWLLEADRPPHPVPGAFPRFAEKARFTRDGAWIAFTARERFQGPGDVWLARPDGSEMRPLAAAPGADDHSTRPSPSRDEIAFISDRDGSPDLFLVDLAGGAAHNLTRSPGRREAAPRWSPDGERILLSILPDAPDASDARALVVDRRGAPLLEVPGAMPDWMPPWPDPR